MTEPPRRQRHSAPPTLLTLVLAGLIPGCAGGAGAIELNSGNPSTTTLTSSTNPARTGAPVTLTATVKDQSSHPITTGTVTFTENGSPPAGTVGGNNVVAVDGNGHATFTTGALTEGDHPILATFNSVSFNSSSQSLIEREDNSSTASINGGNAYSYCNAGAILIPAGSGGPSDIGPANPNPSNIFVTNLPGTIQTVGVSLDGFFTSAGQITSISSLLVGPGAMTANAFDFFSGTGGTAAENGNFTFSDGAALVPHTAFSSGTYQPTSYISATFSSSPSGFFTLPAGPYPAAAPFGTSTFASTYTSEGSGNGTWSLYFNQNIHADNGGVSRGWCLHFVENLPTANAVMGHLGAAPANHFKQGEQNASFTLTIVNNGPGPTGDPDGQHPLVVQDTLPADVTLRTPLPTGAPWDCSAVGQELTCQEDDAIAATATFPVLTIPVNVSASAAATLNNQASMSGDGLMALNSNVDTVIVDPAPVLAVTKSHAAPFTQGQTAVWTIQVTNNATSASGRTDGSTVTVSDVLPSGFTLQGFTGTGWACNGTTTVTCTTTAVVSGGATNFNSISLTVNVPPNSVTQVTNTANVFGGGDVVHTSAATAATGSDTVAINQAPASITINGLAVQSAQINTAFGNLAVTVRDAANAVIPEYSPVTFTAPASGASGTFGNGTNTTQGPANFSGVASPGPFTANGKVGPYVLTVAAGSAPEATFVLTNTTPLDFFTLVPCRVVDTRLPNGPTGGPALAPGAARTFTIVGACGVSLTADAVSVNVTVANPVGTGGIRVFPADLATAPNIAETVAFSSGVTRANNAVLLLGQSGALTVLNDSAVTINVIIDVTGDFE